MKSRLASLALMGFFLYSATSVKAQILVSTVSGGSYPVGCVTILTPLPLQVPIFGQTSPTVVVDSSGNTVLIPSLPFLVPESSLEVACAAGVNVDIGGVLKPSGGIGFADGTTLTSAPPVPASSVWSSFALAFVAPYTISTFTPDNNVTVTRIQAQLPFAPSHCHEDAVISVTDGTSTATLTLSALANDSGSLAANFKAGTPLTLQVSTPAACWGGIPPTAANIVVQYAATH
jgi:hypothetical protein